MKTNILLLSAALLTSLASTAQKKEASLEMLVPGGKEFRAHYPYGAYGTFVNGHEFIKDSIVYTSNDIANITSYEAFTSKGNLLVIANGDTLKVNDETKDGIVYGESVHRNEFGIEKGTFWSNNGQKLAFYRMDESMVEQYPIVNITSREAAVEPIHYPMAGMTSHEVSIGVFKPADLSTVYLKTASPVNRYFTNIAWSLDDKYITVAEINREQNHMWFNIYDATDGSLVKTLFEEENEAWVEPCTPALFISNTQFVWISERNGFKHLYLYDINNGSCKQLTDGQWCVSELYCYNAKAKEIYFQANRESYLCRDIYKVNLKGVVTRLSEGYGVHSAKFSPDLTVFLDNCSSVSFAMRSTIRGTKNGKCIQTVKEIRDPYEEYDMPQIKTVDLKSADGNFDLTGMVMLPSDFDASKKYPVIVYLYGGPHSQMITAGWLNGVSTWKLALAQRGYIVFTMDNRGTELRGAAYEHAIHRQLGKCEMEDQMVGINYLKSLPYVDSERIGIHGWSFGGFMTISMMLNHNDIFKAGVAGGPVCDWSLYEVMYGERYMDTPEENPEGYKMNNISQQTGNLKGRLMVIHGDIDPVVVWQNSLRLLQNAVKNDVLIDYAVYPQHEHNVLGHDRVHLFKKIFQYFDDFLK
ncbi:MAG: S9 family peptidase [Bacteroidales bacterium]|nr:S9 family peptidase [Bacteroidales bacterium]